MDAPTGTRTVSEKRTLYVLVTLTLCATVLGYFSGVSDHATLRRYRPAQAQRSGEIQAAPTYTQERDERRGNRARHGGNLAAMESLRPQIVDLVPPVDDATRAAALRRRATLRAYNGAPPVIPHAIDQGAYPNCATCHDRGMRVGERYAPMMPHPRYENCYQCHVVSERPAPGFALNDETPPFSDNAFVGLEVTEGQRAWGGAPPTIPHSTAMRSRCESCHGVLGHGIRSSHPWRSQCVQCHGVSAALDQRPATFFETAPSAALIPGGPPVGSTP